jgi:tellurite resistance protein TerC
MYVLLAGIVHKFVYLKYGLSLVLVFVGAKMMLLDIYKVPTAVSLGVITLLIGGSIAASLWADRRGRGAGAAPGSDDREIGGPGAAASPTNA